MNGPLIIAHRGASELAPENTLAAFGRAVADGAEGVEFDVRLTKDGEVIVFHDATLKRIAGDRRHVSSLTLAELRQMDIGSWFNRRFPNRACEDFSAQTISTLAEVLEFLRDFRGVIYIELKCREAGAEKLARAVCETIADSHLLPQMIVKSFELETLPFIKKFCPEATTAALFAPQILTILRKEKRLIEVAREAGAEMLSLHFSLATRKLMEKAAARALPVTIWTANNPRWVRRARELGIYAVITNNPARLLAKRAEIVEKVSHE